MSSNRFQDSLISFESNSVFHSASLASPAISAIQCYDFLTLLGVAQALNVDFVPISWDTRRANIGQGGTANISQSSIDVNRALAFKRLASKGPKLTEEDQKLVYEALIAEVSILGHRSIRSHRKINRLEGICWDIDTKTGVVWPALVFEKTSHGDLEKFMQHGAGSMLDFSQRLRLCADIATALSDLHLNGIVHGDLKPANVLVSNDSAKQYVAKVTDFGYSSWLGNAGTLILMPFSRYWTAPEWHHRPIERENAIKMDIYSCGLLCLWILFYNNPHKERRQFYEDLEVLDCDTLGLAHQFVDQMASPARQSRSSLRQLFDMSLATDPVERCSTLGQLLCHLEPNRGSQSPTTEDLRNDLLATLPHFRVAPSIVSLYQCHHAVRKYIAACLEERVLQASAHRLSSKNAAFELAVCFTLGFGVHRDESRASALLEQAGRSQEELNEEIEQVRRDELKPRSRQGVYSLALFQGHLRLEIGGDIYEDQFVQDEASFQIRREIVDVQSILGDDHRVIAILKSTLGKIFQKQGRWEEAQNLQVQTLICIQKRLGQKHPDTIATRSILAMILSKRKQWKQAELLQRQVVTAGLSELGLDHNTTLASMGTLASMLRTQGKWEDAKRLGKQVLKISREALGSENPDTISLSAVLSSLEGDQNFWKSEESRALKHEQYRTNLLLPARSNKVSRLRSPIEERGLKKENEDYLLRMMTLKETELGRDHPLVLEILMVLAKKYHEQGRWQEAEEKVKEVVEIRKARSPEHSFTTTDVLFLGTIYVSQGRLKDAEELQLQAVQAVSCLEETAPDRLLVMSHLVANYSKQGRLSEAELLQVQIMESNIIAFGREHDITLNSMGQLAMTYMRQGRWQAAEALVLHVVSTRLADLGPDDMATLASMANLAKVYTGQQRWDEAEKLAAEVVEKKQRLVGDSHPKTIRSMRDLAAIWHSQKRVQEAVTLISQVVTMSEATLGLTHPDTISRKQTRDEWLLETNETMVRSDTEQVKNYHASLGAHPSSPEKLSTASSEAAICKQREYRELGESTLLEIPRAESQWRQKLASLEKQLVSPTARKGLPKVFLEKIRLRRDLLLEYGVD